MPRPPSTKFVVLDGGLEQSLDAWDPPRLAADAALMTPLGAVGGRLLLYERSLEFRPTAGGGRTRVVIALEEIVSIQRELVVLARRSPLALALRIAVPDGREVRILVRRPGVWVTAVRCAAETAGPRPQPSSALRLARTSDSRSRTADF